MENNENKQDLSLFTLENILGGNTDIVPEEVEIDENEDSTDDVDTTEDDSSDDKSSNPDEGNNDDKNEDSSTDDEDESLKPFYDALNKELGIEDFKFDEVEEGIPGLMNYLKDIVHGTVDQEVESIKSMGDGLVGDLYDYLRNGGKVEEFKKTFLEPTPFSSLDIEDNENNQKAVLKAFLESQDYDKEEIADKLESYESAGILEKEAKSAQRKLIKIEEVNKQNFLKNQETAAKQREAQVQEYWTDIKNTITNSKEIGGFPIADKDKAAFYDYMSKPGKDGLTALQKLYMDKEASLRLAYAAFKDFKFENVVKKAKTETVKDVKKAITRFTDTNAKASKSSQYDIKTNNKPDFQNFVLPIH